MQLLILGASGGVGRWMTRLAAAEGHAVRALVRPATVYEAPPAVDVLRGEPLQPGVLEAAVAGVDAVVSCLGQRRAGRSPWSAALSPPDLMGRVTRELVPAMRRGGVQRLLAVSAGGVGDSVRQLSAPVRWLVRQGRIGDAYRDLEAMERLLAASDLDWLAVRPVTLVDGASTGRAREVSRYGLASMVRRSDVAAWMLAALSAPPPAGRHTILLGA